MTAIYLAVAATAAADVAAAAAALVWVRFDIRRQRRRAAR